EHVGARFEQARDHLLVSGGRAERGDDLGAAKSSHRAVLVIDQALSSSRRPRQLRRRLAARRRQKRRAGGERPLRGAFNALGELHGPGALLAGVDFEETGLVVAARQAILVSLDG